MEGAPPFPSHLFANWETFFCIYKKTQDKIILIHSQRDRHLGSLWVEDLLGGEESLHVGHEEEDTTVVQCRQLIVKLWVLSFDLNKTLKVT